MKNRSLIVLVSFLWMGATCSFGQKQPNIIVILADDMGFSDLGCTGSEITNPAS